MTRVIRCTHVNSYATSLDPPDRQATDHRARITADYLGESQITVEIVPSQPETAHADDGWEDRLPFIDFDLTPTDARELASELLRVAAIAARSADDVGDGQSLRN